MERLKRIGGWIRRHPVWSAIMALVIAAIAWSVLVPDKPTYAYDTEAVTRGDVASEVTASGKLRARNTIKVGAEVSGQIMRVNADFNTPVRAGQVLAAIDPTRFRARVQQADAQVALARSSLVQAQAQVVRAETDLAVQQRDYARRSSLSGDGFVSKAALDQSGNLVATSRAALRTARAQVASAEAQIAQANAERSSAMLDLNRTVIVAPVSGVVINRLVEPGMTVAASFQTPNLFEIAADTTLMQVEASVDEADIGQVSDGQKVSFTVDAYPDERFPAVVKQIRKAATETQNVVSYLVILEVANPEGKLLPGMTANVSIVTGERANVLRIPTAALRFRPKVADRPEAKAADAGKPTSEGTRAALPPGTAEVWVVGADPYKPQKRRIRIGVSGEDFVEVTGGLKAGDKVLVRSRSLEPRKESDEEDGDDTAS